MTVIVAVAVLAGLLGSDSILAQDNLSPRWKFLWNRNNNGLVDVTAILPHQFTIKRRNGQEFICCFRMQDGEKAAFSDMKVGDWIIVGGAKNKEGDLIAKIVVYLPKNFQSRCGRITNVDTSGEPFTFVERNGEEESFTVDEITVY